MAKNNNLTDFLKNIADTIRAKCGVTGKINPQEFTNYIGGGGSTENCTVSLNLKEFDGNQFAFLYASYEDGILTRQWFEPDEADWSEYTISVAKNTPLTIYYPGGNMLGAVDDVWETLDESLYVQNYNRAISLYHILITKDTHIELNPDY